MYAKSDKFGKKEIKKKSKNCVYCLKDKNNLYKT